MTPISHLRPNLRLVESYSPDANQERRLHYYTEGETIPLEHQGIWQVSQGLIKLSMVDSQGEEVMLGLIGPSLPFGDCLTSVHAYQATALTNVQLLRFSLQEIESSPALGHTLFTQLSRRLCQTEVLLAIAGQRLVEDRLRQLLMLLKQDVGQPVAEGTRLSVRLTHQTLASAIGTSRVTITRLISKLKQKGLLKLDQGRHIVLKDHSFWATSSPEAT